MTKQTRRRFLAGLGATAGSLASLSAGQLPHTALSAEKSRNAYQVGAYYFPNYHVDPRNEELLGKDWTEWELVKAARPRFKGHRQPRVPTWGYTDEADPQVMEKKIDAAADHGLDYWIFDWYWYNNKPFLQRCLEEGYFAAKNNRCVKFCCMWANHNWLNIFPAKRGAPPKQIWPGTVSKDTFNRVVDYVIHRYFKHPSHFNIEGCPYFSLYDLNALTASFGGLEQTREMLDSFRDKTKAAGFPDLHLNAVAWGQPVLPGTKKLINPAEQVRRLGFDSVTSYVWIHHVVLNQFPQTDYRYVQDKYFEYWLRAEKMFDIPYYPNVSVGWDSSPRTNASDEFADVGYPFMPTISGNTPARFREALAATKQRIDADAKRPKILNINSWNEWTEGSYLEPDTVTGLGYLKAIRTVFG